MKRPGYLALSAALLLAAAPSGHADGRFDQKLPSERQVVHVLNRLTFGPRPGDVEQVRRIGIDAWIDQQLHPDRVIENPVLADRLRSLVTLDLPTWKILQTYTPLPAALMGPPPSTAAFNSLPNDQRNVLMFCSVQERTAAIAALEPEARRLVLAGGPPRVTEGLADDLVQEAASARKAEQEARQKEFRRLMPPLNELLSPEQIRTANNGTVDEKRALLDSLDAEKRRLVLRALAPQALAGMPSLRREAQAIAQPQIFVNGELIEQKLYRAVYSNRQLEEVLVDFWMNHFNVFNGKAQGRVLLTSFERDAIRPYVFGHFRDMLLATARHPAMLVYLDNWQSQVPRDDFPVPAGVRRPGLNENYGRELLELHTLGVDGGYTQEDVIAVARAFSGWTVYDLQKFGEFQFNPGGHDRREKTILGRTLPPMRGEQDGLDVIDILARHPSTARFISKKLAQRFVADDPPKALIDRMAATFAATDGDLRAVLQTLFKSPEFLSEGSWQAKMKAPLEMVISSVRATDASVTDTFVMAQRIADLGEPLYGKVEPTGYPNTGEAWANTAGIIGRINFATALTSGQLAGVRVDMSRFNFKDPSTVARTLLSAAPSPATVAAIQKGTEGTEVTPSLLASLVISSPDFQRR
jgi:uncharacterized protein (DUF1800 family)